MTKFEGDTLSIIPWTQLLSCACHTSVRQAVKLIEGRTFRDCLGRDPGRISKILSLHHQDVCSWYESTRIQTGFWILLLNIYEPYMVLLNIIKL